MSNVNRPKIAHLAGGATPNRTITLRDYQQSAVDAALSHIWFDEGHPLVVAPTGSGKAVMNAAIVDELLAGGGRVLCLTHVKELVEQNAKTFHSLSPSRNASTFCAGLGKKNPHGDVVFGSVQTIHSALKRLPSDVSPSYWKFAAVLIDEAHLLSPKAGSTYRMVLDILTRYSPNLRVVGLTATPYRLGQGMLHKGDGAFFTDIVYDIPMQLLVDRGYLSPLISQPPQMEQSFDLAGLKTQAGDFIDKEMANRFNTDAINNSVVREAWRLGADRKAWIAFCINVEHAEAMAAAIQEGTGRTAFAVHGKTPKVERDHLLRAYVNGQIDALTSVGVLTTGFDAPRTDMLIMARPTQSPGLYVQMAGRGMRIHPDKSDCLVLDFANNVALHGPVDAVNPPPEPKKRSAIVWGAGSDEETVKRERLSADEALADRAGHLPIMSAQGGVAVDLSIPVTVTGAFYKATANFLNAFYITKYGKVTRPIPYPKWNDQSSPADKRLARQRWRLLAQDAKVDVPPHDAYAAAVSASKLPIPSAVLIERHKGKLMAKTVFYGTQAGNE